MALCCALRPPVLVLTGDEGAEKFGPPFREREARTRRPGIDVGRGRQRAWSVGEGTPVGDDERDRDGEFAGEEEREIDEASRRSSRVAAGVASEAIVKLVLVGLLANVARVEEIGGWLSIEAADSILGQVGKVGLAAREQIGSRLATHVLDA